MKRKVLKYTIDEYYEFVFDDISQLLKVFQFRLSELSMREPKTLEDVGQLTHVKGKLTELNQILED